MVRAFASALALSACLFAGAACAQSSGGTGNQGTYQPQGPDTGYDDMKADTEKHKTADELATGADLVKAQKYADAIPHLEEATHRNPRNAAAFLYLGFAHRMLAGTLPMDQRGAEFDKASTAYQQSLAIDPNNKLLHEYLGKLYLLRREYDHAADELKNLDTLCPSGCDEHTALAQAIAANPPPPKAP